MFGEISFMAVVPGHMNVLLAEAGVPYDLISDLDEIDAEFETADLALIIGANDLVNPDARTNKRSIDIALFVLDQTRTLHGGAQVPVGQLIQAVKASG
jgi:NAD(P) transhydrogenase subunit beta